MLVKILVGITLLLKKNPFFINASQIWWVNTIKIVFKAVLRAVYRSLLRSGLNEFHLLTVQVSRQVWLLSGFQFQGKYCSGMTFINPWIMKILVRSKIKSLKP